MFLCMLEDAVIPLIVGLTGFGISFIYKSAVGDAILKIAELVKDKDKEQKKQLYSVMSIMHGADYYGYDIGDNKQETVPPVNAIDNKLDRIIQMQSDTIKEVETIKYDLKVLDSRVKSLENEVGKIEKVEEEIKRVKREIPSSQDQLPSPERGSKT